MQLNDLMQSRVHLDCGYPLSTLFAHQSKVSKRRHSKVLVQGLALPNNADGRLVLCLASQLSRGW